MADARGEDWIGTVLGRFADIGELIADRLACRRGERLVFAGLSCHLPPGGALVLAGANGSGKSSLLRLLATLLTPAAGGLAWRGVSIADDPPRYRAALHYLGHLDATKPALSPRESLGFWAALRGGRAPAAGVIEAALDEFGLAEIADWPCRWLSAGQRRRLALSRLVATPAPLWLLDEPSAALDADGEARLAAAIARHRAADGSVALATHQPLDLPDAATILMDDFAPTVDDAIALPW